MQIQILQTISIAPDKTLRVEKTDIKLIEALPITDEYDWVFPE